MMLRLLAIALALPLLAPAQDKGKKKTGPTMDYGPFLSCAVMSKPGTKFDNNTGNFDGDVTARGILLRLADDWSDGMVFDTDSLRMSAGWLGGTPRFTGVIFDGGHGPSPTMTVPPVFQTPNAPGWAKEGSFKEPRANSIAPLPPPGPLPADWAKFKGLYLNGSRVILSYTVGKCAVLESPSIEGKEDAKALVRSFTLGASEVPLELRVATATPELGIEGVGLPDGAKIVTLDGDVRLQIPALKASVAFKLLLGPGAKGTSTASTAPLNLTELTQGGAARWTEPVTTQGVLAKETGPYVVDRLTIPEKNPWSAKMRVGGFDFFRDGERAALCTWDGDVWIVSGIDAKLEKLTWKRFATGLYQPLGLRIVDDVIYTVGHDQITRFHDVNGDGEADFYENFNNDWELTTAFHTFCFDLHTDPVGNFYFAFNAPVRSGCGGFHRITNHHGTILKVSKDGSKLEVFATGFRANNGIGVGPNGEVTSGDNEGSWVPKCPLHWVKPGSFNGVVDAAHRPLNSAKGKPDPAEQPKPLCWMPKEVDNSGGGQAWVTTDTWGPFKGELLHGSYGTSSLYKVLKEEVNGQVQGGVVKFPLKFTSSVMRMRFNTKDGQLYNVGLRGWQSNAAREGGFDRIRYTGAPLCMPAGLRVTPKGVAITFTSPLNKELAENVDRYSVSMWNYRWTSNYGSGHHSTREEPGALQKKGDASDPVGVKSAKLSEDGRTVALELEEVKPVMQMKIAFKLEGADKTPANYEIHNTIHVVPEK